MDTTRSPFLPRHHRNFDEVVSTGTFDQPAPHHARALDNSDHGELVTLYDDDEKKSC